MIVALIVVVILWYTFKDSSSRLNVYSKDLQDKQKVEIRSSVDRTQLVDLKREIHYVDVVNEITTVKAYRQLVSDYEAGLIEKPEFQEKAAALVEKIDIREIR